MPSRAVRTLAERLYSEYRSESDILDEVIRSRLAERTSLLDVGCGSGYLFPRDYRGSARLVVGLDIDPALNENSLVDDRVFGSVEALPFGDNCFDVIFSRYVFEHLNDPAAALYEIVRVLRPGGVFILLTPNVWHYVPLAARFTSSRFHKFFNARIRGRAAGETFPTLYRANSQRTLSRLAAGAGLDQVEIRMIETRPNYLMWSLPTFLAGAAYERVVNATDRLRNLRVNILATYQKPIAQAE